jgi:hypothetical protein
MLKVGVEPPWPRSCLHPPRYYPLR